jgi:hypothetical protein
MSRQITFTKSVDEKLHRLLCWFIGTNIRVSKLGLKVTLGVETCEMRRVKLMIGLQDRLLVSDDLAKNPTRAIYADYCGMYCDGKRIITRNSPKLLQLARREINNDNEFKQCWEKQGFSRLKCPNDFKQSILWNGGLRYLQLYVINRLPGAKSKCKLCGVVTSSYTSHAASCASLSRELRDKVIELSTGLMSRWVNKMEREELSRYEEILRELKDTMEGTTGVTSQ